MFTLSAWQPPKTLAQLLVMSWHPPNGMLATMCGEMSRMVRTRKAVGGVTMVIWQVELQPSPFIVLPSSHCSGGLAPVSV